MKAETKCCHLDSPGRTARIALLFACLSILFLYLVAPSTTLSAESVSMLLQKGIFAEETEGDLDAAIKIYQEIVAEAQANRTLIAQAQFRLAMCHLKKGQKDEAAGAFREIVDRFATETELVGKARTHLSELGQPAPGVVVRLVWSEPLSRFGYTRIRPSPDGRYAAWVDGNVGGDLNLRDLRTGVTRNLTNRTNEDESAVQCAFSPDGRRIACSWAGKDELMDLRIIDLDNTTQRVLRTQTNLMVLAEDWSPDGKSIAAVVTKDSQRPFEYRISLISTADGSEQKVTAQRDKAPGTVRFSPDGRYLAYNSSPYYRETTNEIVIVDLGQGTQAVVSQPSFDEKFVGWAPEGDSIVFTSDRRGSADLWSANVHDGRPAGEPRLLKAGLGEVTPRGMSRDGTFLYSAFVELSDVHLTKMDIDTGKLLSPLKLVQSPSAGSNDRPLVSGDGKYLLYRSGQKEKKAYRLNLESWNQEELPDSSAWAFRLLRWWWTPDPKTLLVSLYGTTKSRQGYYVLSADTGNLTAMALISDEIFYRLIWGARFDDKSGILFRRYSNPSRFTIVKFDLPGGRETEYQTPVGPGGSFTFEGPWLCQDQKTLLFDREKNSGSSHTLVAYDLETKSEKTLYESEGKIIDLIVNPAGDHALLGYYDNRKRRVTKYCSFSKSEVREELSTVVPEGFKTLWHFWKGPQIVLEKTTEQGDAAPREIWTYSFATGALKKTDLTLAAYQVVVQINEESGHVLLQTAPPRRQELWALENLFPTGGGRN